METKPHLARAVHAPSMFNALKQPRTAITERD